MARGSHCVLTRCGVATAAGGHLLSSNGFSSHQGCLLQHPIHCWLLLGYVGGQLHLRLPHGHGGGGSGGFCGIPPLGL